MATMEMAMNDKLNKAETAMKVAQIFVVVVILAAVFLLS